MPSRDQFTTEIYVNGEQARDALSKLTKDLEKLRNQYANLNKSSKNYEIRERELADQIKATEQAIATAEKGTDSYRRAMENLSKRGIDQLIKMQRQLNSEIKKLDPNDAEFKRLSENYQKVTQRIKDLKAAQEGASAGGGIFKRAGNWLSEYYGALVIGYQTIKKVAQGFMEAYKTISNFEQANANLSTILGVNRDQMKDLEDAALELGSTTRYTASEVTNLQTELAKLGFTQKEILDMEPSVLNFATAVGTDLASAASMAGVALRSFGLTSEETEDALGTMAAACNKSALSFSYLQSAFSTIAPVAKTYGLSLKDTIALLGTLANAGFDASSAATATRNILLKMVKTGGDLSEALGGSVKTFDEIMNGMIKLRDSGLDLAGAFELTDQRSVSAFSAFLDGAESAKELRASIEDVNGALAATAEVRADTVEGAIAGLQSAWEGFILSFRNSSGTVKEMIKSLTEIVRKLPQYSDGIVKVTKAVVIVVAAIKTWTLVEKAKNAVVAAGSKLAAARVVIVESVRLAYFKLTGNTIKAAAAQTALNTAMAANPFGAVVAIVGVLSVAISRLVGRQREATEQTDALAEAEKRANEEYGEQAGKVRALTSIVENNNISLGERKKALEELKSIVPGYHGDLTEEGRLINSNKEAIDEYCKSLREQIRLEARKDKLLEIEKQIAALEVQKADAQERQHQALVESGGDTTEIKETHSFWRGQQFSFTDYGQAKKDEADAQKRIDELEGQAKKISDRIGKIFTDPIDKVMAEYEAMFDQIRKESIDNPKAGEEEIKRLQAERDLKIAELKKTSDATKQVVATENAILTQTQFDYLQERQEKLTKKEKEMVAKGYAALSAEDSKALKARYDKLNKTAGDQQQKQYNEKKKQLDAALNYEEKQLKLSLLQKEISEEEYNAKIKEKKAQYYKDVLALAEKYGQDESSILASQLDDQIKDLEEAAKKAAEAARKAAKEAEDAAKKEMEKWEKKMKELEELEKKAQDVRDSLRPKERINREYENELQNLEDLHTAKLISEQDYLDAVDKLRKDHNKALLDEDLANMQEYVEKANAVIEFAGNFVTQLKEFETQKMEAEYQAQLTAAGDNAEKREAIESEYEQKKLDLQKKYADTEMVINIAKAVAAGALAAIQAFNAAGGNPILGGVFAALIAATTAAEVATIVAQRNAIKATSVSSTSTASSGSTDNTMQTGTRTITGYSEGGNTKRAASDATVVGVVHANEWVAPAWMVRENPTVFADLEEYRVTLGRGRKKLGNGFADGGLASPQSGSMPTPSPLEEIDWQALRDFNAIMRYCATHGIFVKYGDIMIAKEKHDNFKKQTSR